ncbi:MAG TPA: HIT family protein [Candidatus Saccharimonadales bacterium]|nr:HIT family protein [Candidatus Saccharimonadales bacterium]
MQPSIFSKIISGEIPSHKVYEDDRTFAFLDIHPAQPGHTLVVPKKQVDRLEELPVQDYRAVMETVQKVMHRVVEVFGPEYRACLKLEGFDVPHAHIHIIPCKTAADFWTKQDPAAKPNHQALAAVAQRLAF